MPKINPRFMTWARESAGLSVADAARAIGLSGANAVTRLEEMEAGRRDPSRRQLVEMAKKYRRPLLTFYPPEPPGPGARTHDFRTLPHREAGSEAVLDALVRDVKARQALVRSALEDAEEDQPLPFVGSVQAGEGAEALAEAMRRTLAFDLAEYRAASTIDEAFRILRDAVEQAGVLVILKGNLGHYTSNLSPSVFRGFALADPVAPFVVINETDSRSAWSFTLLHELAQRLSRRERHQRLRERPKGGTLVQRGGRPLSASAYKMRDDSFEIRRCSRRNAIAAAGAGVAVATLGAAPAAAQNKVAKEAFHLGVPWEDQYGYAQAVKVGDTIYVSGQLSHDDEGKMIAPPPLDPAGKIADHGNMGPQMAQSYANVKKVLAAFGATMDDIVEEVIYVTDMDAAFAVAGEVRAAAYGGRPVVASTILVTPRLALPEQLIEIKVIAKV